jgi:hypothetical protein
LSDTLTIDRELSRTANSESIPKSEDAEEYDTKIQRAHRFKGRKRLNIGRAWLVERPETNPDEGGAAD